MKDLKKAQELWNKLADIPINEEEEIEESFLHFPVRTDRQDIWHWFERTFDCSVAKDLEQL